MRRCRSVLSRAYACSNTLEATWDCKSLSHLVITVTRQPYHSPRSTPSDTPFRERIGRECTPLTSNRIVVRLLAL